MNSYSRFVFAAAGLLTSVAATAQQRVRYTGTALVPEVQVEVALPGSDYLLASYSLVGTTGPYYGNRFDPGQLRVGYEHFWSEHWSGGATVRFVSRGSQGNGDLPGLSGILTPGLLVRHRSTLGPVSLGQRLGLEYAMGSNYYGSSGPINRALVRLRLDAEHVFGLSNHLALRPRVAYEAAAYLRLQRDSDELKERVIDFGSLRGEVGVRLSPRLDLTPWVAWQTAYRNSLFFYDALGNQVSGGRNNAVILATGLDLRLTLGGNSPERRQLPSQH